MPKPKTVTEYINAAAPDAKKMLTELRAILKKAAPHATEALKWGNPVFQEDRILFAYAAYKKHINFMPTPLTVTFFAKELKDYKTGKGSVQLPYDQPLPKALIQKIALRRVKELREYDAKWM